MLSWKLKARSVQPIGIDIGRNSIKMIQLARREGRTGILAVDKVQFDVGMNNDAEERRNFVISAIGQMLAENHFHGRKVVSCLPSDRVRITGLRLADIQEEEIEAGLRGEFVQQFGFDPDRDVINYVYAGSIHEGDQVKDELVIFAVENEAIRSHIGMLEEAKLRPVALDTVPCALFRSFERLLRRQEDSERTVFLVDVGSQHTTVVFGCGTEISFVKQIPIGGETFNQEVARTLDVRTSEAEILRGKLKLESMANIGLESKSSDRYSGSMRWGLDASTRQVMVDAIGGVAEKLTREISLCFKYYTVTFRGKHVEQGVFAGEEANENILLNVLRRELPFEVEVAQPLKGLDFANEGTKIYFDSDQRGLLCEWAVAVGLSLKHWEDVGCSHMV